MKSMKVPSRKLWKLCELRKNHLLMTKSNLLRHLLNTKVLPTSKALKLYCPGIDDQLLCSDVLTEVGQMYDEM